uniref:Cadherin-like beta-sandwich-like domain-containing protein n=1 Tax=Branchiostoma floridae TaxID=7739 RepID=C3YAA2_BRAFL|eukprot:XP_002606640.1 hypothetical protein BRAFLDRAFT_120093 [Branchiostoma floridae]
MDDCTLEKLGVSPGALTPKFHRDTLEYNVTVASNVEKVKFDVLTSDSGASYQIKNSGGEKTIPLKEGDVTNVQIEVTAEDGTVKIYAVNVKRLSASDATLTTLQLSAGALEPEFAPGTYTYSTTLPCHVSSLTITAKAPDPKAGVKVCGQTPDTPVQLNVGETQVDVEVTSPDGSRQQMYSISVVKEPMGRFVKLADPKLALQLECPVTLGPLYRPISIRESDPKHTYSAPCIDVLTRSKRPFEVLLVRKLFSALYRTSKQDPLDESPLPSEWRIVDFDVDKKVSAAVVSCIYTHTGCTEQIKYGELGAHAKDCQHKPKPEPNAALVTDSAWYKADFASTKKTDSDIKHKVEVRSWEKHLHNVTDSTLKELDDQAKEHLKNYREALPRIGQNQSYEHGKSPLDYLRNAAQCYATGIKMKAKDASLHCSLGLVLEEQYYAKDMYGLKEQDEEDDLGLAGLNLAAKESSKEEEIDAICNLRGVPATAPLARKLKAVDEEFHHLLDGGQTGKAEHVQALYAWKSKQATQTGKAEHVQALYAWKSKQATQDGKVAQQAEDETNTLGQAYLKFLDALSLDQSHTLYNLHVGRMLLLQGKTTEAQARLQLSVGMNPKNQAARFYLGLAMAMAPKGPPQDRLSETITFLNEGVETVLAQRCALAEGTAAQSQPNLHSEDLWRLSNLQMLRGFQLLGQLLAKQDPPQGCMSALDVLHNATLLSSQAMCEMVHRGEVYRQAMCEMVHRGEVYRQVEWMLLTSHYQLLEHLAAKQAGKEDLIALRCRDLSALIRACSIPQNTELLVMQEKTCQKGVLIRPCDSSALCHLAYAQLARYDDEPSTDAAARALRDSRLTFHTCIGLEGKPVAGEPLSEITGQQWWQDKVAKEEEEKKAAEAAKKPAAAPTGPARGAAARGRAAPAAAARGGRGAAAASVGNPKSVPSSSPPPKPGTPAGRGAAVPSSSLPPKSGTSVGRGAAAGKSAISTAKPASVQKAQSSTTSTSSTKTNSSSSKNPAGRGAISTTKSSATQKAPARGRGAPAAKAAPAPRGGAARGGAAGKAAPPARGGPAARGGAAKPAAAPAAGKPACKPGEKAEDKPATPTKATEPEKTPAPIPANTPLNRASYRPRLGLARALARTDDTIDDAKKWYNEVMTMAPEIHDAYIELADMLIKAEPLAAVDVYCRFPFPEELTFDDAYIHGEVVRILMKHEKFDDPRLADSMIAFGRVMGITTLDKYVSILDDKFKTDMLKKIYAGVHGKAVDDPDLQAFFKFKCWD